MNPILGIVIVAYKSRDEIEVNLASLPGVLDGRSVEVIVVDNSAESVEALVRRFAYVQYLAPAKNLGFGSANILWYCESTLRAVSQSGHHLQ